MCQTEDTIFLYLRPIVSDTIFRGYQNKSYGTELLKELEKLLKEKGVACLELSSVNDEFHKHFYSKLGFYEAKNFIMMGKFFE